MPLKIQNKQNDENQELYSQGTLLGRLVKKAIKKYMKNSNLNKNRKDKVGKLETIGYGYQKTKFANNETEVPNLKESEPK